MEEALLTAKIPATALTLADDVGMLSGHLLHASLLGGDWEDSDWGPGCMRLELLKIKEAVVGTR